MDPKGCGCPPTGGAGRVHHVFVNVKDVGRSCEFYDWLMPQLGYPTRWEYEGGRGYLGPHGSFWLKPADPRFAGDAFHKDRVGLCEIAFRAESRAEIDALARDIPAMGGSILDPPREYPEYVPGYYAVFFADPDGIKLEYAYTPG